MNEEYNKVRFKEMDENKADQQQCLIRCDINFVKMDWENSMTP